ncbi:S-adenosyl-L-methionine-dependent methyltransferase [Cristinia sonorae]|uniref:S-adenosyl-L-methionine-dependent methyltransferase n=1 Tax=Cristinia sonorae TaxID=1940300 RepID=A0A8K0XQ21_9AGAR|nr:S-adenosyl-L-methionine-dependent methyltransferase [Cristinia sonorae]
MNFYFEAGKVLDKLDAKQGSIKGIIATLPEKDRKRTAAAVIETLKYKTVLNEVLDASKLLKEEKKLKSRNLVLVLVHDLLLSGGIQAGEGPIKQAILRHKTRLNSEFTRIKIKHGVKSTKELAQTGDERAAKIPRYIRVNTTCWSMEEAIKEFISRGHVLSGPFDHPKGFKKDDHIDNLLLFPPDSQWVEDELYKSGKVILQDKASCFPAQILSPPASDNGVVIDATAAPGNKTSHLSALMQGKGKLYAFERDRRRFSTLQMMLQKARCKNVEPVNTDFLTTSPEDPKFSTVTHILLDPSCSGSGIVNRLDHLLENETESSEDQESRLNKLSGFQLMMIKHAMKFPSVERIVYSTCSIHAVENEYVVRAALKSEECTAGRFKLAPKAEVLPTWHRRGIAGETESPDEAESLIRCSPGEDATNGFFVSLFVRESNTRMNKRKAGEEMTEEANASSSSPTAKRRKKKKKRASGISIGQ